MRTLFTRRVLLAAAIRGALPAAALLALGLWVIHDFRRVAAAGPQQVWVWSVLCLTFGLCVAVSALIERATQGRGALKLSCLTLWGAVSGLALVLQHVYLQAVQQTGPLEALPTAITQALALPLALPLGAATFGGIGVAAARLAYERGPALKDHLARRKPQLVDLVTLIVFAAGCAGLGLSLWLLPGMILTERLLNEGEDPH